MSAGGYILKSPNLAHTAEDGERVSLAVGDKVTLVGTSKIGKCRFVGAVPFSNGIWVGLELADASGRNDGSVQGRRYFACKPRHGLFVRASSCIKMTTSTTGGSSSSNSNNVSTSSATSHAAKPASTSNTSSTSSTTSTSVSNSSSTSRITSREVEDRPPLRSSASSDNSLSVADAMLEKIQTILGSARRPGLDIASRASLITKNVALPPSPPHSPAAPTPAPVEVPVTLPVTVQQQSAPPDSAALAHKLFESSSFQSCLQKLVTDAVSQAMPPSTAASSATPSTPTKSTTSTAAKVPSTPSAATTALLKSAAVAGLEGRVAGLETCFQSIASQLERIQLSVADMTAAAAASAKASAASPARTSASTATETTEQDTGRAEERANANALEVQRLQEALQIVSQLTREAQEGIVAERAKRKEEIESLLAQLAKYRGTTSPSATPPR